MPQQGAVLDQVRGQKRLTSRERVPPEEKQGEGEKGGGATVAVSDRGFTSVKVAGVQGCFHSSSGARGLQAASAEGVGTERHEGGSRGDAEVEVEPELDDWATGAVPLPSLSPSLGPGHGQQWQRGLGWLLRQGSQERTARTS